MLPKDVGEECQRSSCFLERFPFWLTYTPTTEGGVGKRGEREKGERRRCTGQKRSTLSYNEYRSNKWITTKFPPGYYCKTGVLVCMYIYHWSRGCILVHYWSGRRAVLADCWDGQTPVSGHHREPVLNVGDMDKSSNAWRYICTHNV